MLFKFHWQIEKHCPELGLGPGLVSMSPLSKWMIQTFSTPIIIFTNSLQKLMQTNYLQMIKTRYTLFHKNSIKDDLPLKLPDLKTANNQIERKKTIKFLEVVLDESLN